MAPFPPTSRPPVQRSVLRLALAAATLAPSLVAQTSSSPTPAPQPAVSPAGVLEPAPTTPTLPPAKPTPTQREVEDADQAYLRGIKARDHGDLPAAVDAFTEATRLNPQAEPYALALTVARDRLLQQILQQAAKAHLSNHEAEANALLERARQLDPTNAMVAQHFGIEATTSPQDGPQNRQDRHDQFARDAATLAGPPEFQPKPGRFGFHLTASSLDLARAVYSAWGINLQSDQDFHATTATLNLDDVDFSTATHVLAKLTHSFVVPIDGKLGLLANDTEDAHQRLSPMLEETLEIPGATQEQLTQYANLARNVFELSRVSTSEHAGALVLRGDEATLQRLNATYADLLETDPDITLELTLYEVDSTKTSNYGVSLPTGFGGFSVASEAQSIVTANASTIEEAVAEGLITLNGSYYTNLITELALLVGAGDVSSAEFTNFLGTVGSFGGAPLAGVFLESGATLNLALNSSDTRTLEAATLRAGNHQAATLRLGSRYPIVTGVYSVSNTASTAGLTINGVSVSSLLAEYAGTTTTVPQFQYEDLGLTLKVTPDVNKNGDIHLKLDFKIESLGGASLNDIPILNNRALVSDITVPTGKTAMLATLVNRSESRSISGDADRTTELDTNELVLEIKPHISRTPRMRVVSRRLTIDKPAVHTQ